MTRRKSRVIIMEPAAVDVRKAEDFGEITFLFSRRCTRDYDQVQDEIRQRLTETFDPERDYICLVGSIAAIAVLSTIIGDMYGGARYLFFQSGSHEYRPGTIGEPVYEPEKT